MAAKIPPWLTVEGPKQLLDRCLWRGSAGGWVPTAEVPRLQELAAGCGVSVLVNETEDTAPLDAARGVSLRDCYLIATLEPEPTEATMNLYEVRSGMTGESYVRTYAWAESEAAARLLVMGRHGEGCVQEIELLFCADSKPFCTDLSDSGWEP